MKTKCPIGIRGLRPQLDYITLEKIKLFQEYGANHSNARLFLILIGRLEKELISDGDK